MPKAHPVRNALWIVLAGWAGMSGCTHNYYYTTPGCAPTVGQTVSSQVGSVCEVPEQGEIVASTPGTVVGSAPARRIVNAAPNASNSRVVISQPGYSSQTGRAGGNRLAGWRRTDPESSATTRVEGTLDTPSVIR